MSKVKRLLAWIILITGLLFVLTAIIVLMIYDRESLLGISIASAISLLFIWALEEVI